MSIIHPPSGGDDLVIGVLPVKRRTKLECHAVKSTSEFFRKIDDSSFLIRMSQPDSAPPVVGHPHRPIEVRKLFEESHEPTIQILHGFPGIQAARKPSIKVNHQLVVLCRPIIRLARWKFVSSGLMVTFYRCTMAARKYSAESEKGIRSSEGGSSWFGEKGIQKWEPPRRF